MTEDEFNVCDDPQSMLDWLRRGRKLSERKARLFGVVCCYRVESLIIDQCSRLAIMVAEKFADGTATTQELESARRSAQAAATAARRAAGKLAAALHYAAEFTTAEDAYWAARTAADWASPGATSNTRFTAKELAAQANLLRDLVGPLPFRSITIDPAWRTPVVLALAHRAYETRDFSLMPVLGAALSDAGCKDPDILGHAGSQGPHCRGCWIVDLVLEKE